MIQTHSLPCFLLAAGRGERMRALTDDVPKPLLTINNKSLLVWHLEALSKAGIQNVVINHAWLGSQIEIALGTGEQFGLKIAYSPEETALETAGGIAQALPILQPQDYFLVTNGDVFSPDLPIDMILITASKLKTDPKQPLAHLLMVPNPIQHLMVTFILRMNKSTLTILGTQKS